MRDQLEGIEVFVEAAEAGSFSRAAERLALTRSAVGKTIARMEERLGVRLFQRTTRSQGLTEDGQVYYERCLRALAELRAGAALLDAGRREMSGRLKISMPVLFGRFCIAPILMDLARQHPKLELDLRFSDHLVDLVNEGYDLAIRNHTPGSSNALQSLKLVGQRKVVCATPDYLLTHGTPENVTDLSGHEALVYWHRGQIFPWTFRTADGDLVDAELRWRFQFDSYEAVADAAVRGMGMACLPSWLVHEHLQQGRLVTVLDDIASSPFDTYAVWPATQFQPLKLRVTIDTLLEQLQWVSQT